MFFSFYFKQSQHGFGTIFCKRLEKISLWFVQPDRISICRIINRRIFLVKIRKTELLLKVTEKETDTDKEIGMSFVAVSTCILILIWKGLQLSYGGI